MLDHRGPSCRSAEFRRRLTGLVIVLVLVGRRVGQPGQGGAQVVGYDLRAVSGLGTLMGSTLRP